MTVTTALAGIAGQYGAALGFERTALSYYPDLEPGYNTLSYMAPGYGYWISATQAVDLAYPATGATNALPEDTAFMAQERQRSIRNAEWAAAVQPTYEWMNFYGELALPDGTGVPSDTVILAIDPQGTICGATAVWEPGRFGLLACYRDDPATEADEGALPGDAIQLFVSPDGMQPDGQFVGTGIWLAHGERWQVGEGPLPTVDLAITNEVMPQAAQPGATITYTLVYSNVGNLTAGEVVIRDRMPAEIAATGYSSWGLPITPLAAIEGLAWQVADIGPGQGGVITVTGVLSPVLTGALAITNTATISTPLETRLEDNIAEASLYVSASLQSPGWAIWLPLIVRQQP
jgi:uncharacterized repeat protein (TIGR01451 family)